MLTFNAFVVCVHVVLGALAVFMGAIAFSAPKGRKVHIGSGRVFVVGMGVSSLLGAVLGVIKYETLWITFHAGILGATLVTSGVLAARIRTRSAKPWFDIVAVINAMNATGLFAVGLYASGMPDGSFLGFPATDYFFLFGMAAIAGFGDIVMIFRKSVSSKQRVAQHLLRMCIGFFIAAGSAFTGPGASAFPEALQRSGLLSLPELTIFGLMLYWLWRTLRRKAARKETSLPFLGFKDSL